MSINAAIEAKIQVAISESAKATALVAALVATVAALREANESQACGPCAHISLASAGREELGLPTLSYEAECTALKVLRKAGIARLTSGLVARTAEPDEEEALETAVYYGYTAELYVGKDMDSRGDYAVAATDAEGRRWYGKVCGRSIYQSLHRPQTTWVGWI